MQFRSQFVNGTGSKGPQIVVTANEPAGFGKAGLASRGFKSRQSTCHRKERNLIRGKTMLYFINVPHNCSEKELREWIESRGIRTESIRLIRDLVAGVSPAFAYVELQDNSRLKEAVGLLHGKLLRTHIVQVQEARVRPLSANAKRTSGHS
jgi:RNA recognition motif-containing protein